MVVLNVYDVFFLITSALSLVCMVYLAKHFIKRRNIVTLLLVVFFAMFSLTYLGYVLIFTGVIQFDIVTYLLYVSLVDFGVILLIGLVMIRFKELYLLPASILLIGYFHEFGMSTSRDQIIGIIQIFSNINYGQPIGNRWFILLSSLYDVTLPSPYGEILNLLFNPLSIIMPRIDVTIIAVYLFIISAPTIILFYFIAWKNRSGRSLGFALGLTVLNLNLVTGVNEEILATTTFVAMVLFALGIFGTLDEIIKMIKQEPTEVAAKS